jgi:hypothetical protein
MPDPYKAQRIEAIVLDNWQNRYNLNLTIGAPNALYVLFTTDPPASPALGHELGPNGAARDGGLGALSPQRNLFINTTFEK